MLFEIAIGDAYGAGFEFVDNEVIKKENNMEKYYASRIDDLKAGQYTDDTQMSLAIAEMLLSDLEWNKKNITTFFLNAFNRDKRKGYAKGFYSFLETVKNENEFLKKINNSSIRNGAAMRSVPLGYLPKIDELMEKSKIQASITHDTHEGIVSSQAVALMSYYFINKVGCKTKMQDFVTLHTGEIFINNKITRTECDAIDTIDAVFTVLKNSNSLKEVIINSVNLGGDTDSVASISCGLASLSDEFKKDFPQFLIANLENEKFGKDYIIDLDNKLKNKYEK